MALFSPSRRLYEPEAATSVSICGISCATYDLYVSAQSLDLPDLAKNCSFLIWKLELMPVVADFHFWMGTILRMVETKNFPQKP